MKKLATAVIALVLTAAPVALADNNEHKREGLNLPVAEMPAPDGHGGCGNNRNSRECPVQY